MEPIVKWSGSKRAVAARLAALFPRDAARYYEPFLGGGALLPYRPAPAAVAGDTLPELVELWREVQRAPDRVAAEYERRWRRLRDEGHAAFYAVRERFNAERDPHDLLFLSRTCVNGLIRFNREGAFNNSLHHTRPGIAPARLARLAHAWSRAVAGVRFVAADYRVTLRSVRAGDVVFLDPPYAGTRGRYVPQAFDLAALYGELERLSALGARWVLTLDGRAGARRYEVPVPAALYRARVEVPTGHSPFTKLMRTGIDGVVESVYLSFVPSRRALARRGGPRRAAVPQGR